MAVFHEDPRESGESLDLKGGINVSMCSYSLYREAFLFFFLLATCSLLFWFLSRKESFPTPRSRKNEAAFSSIEF